MREEGVNRLPRAHQNVTSVAPHLSLAQEPALMAP
jgi:hypothetical protein